MRRSFILLLAFSLGIFSSMAHDSAEPANDGGDVVFNTSDPIPDTMPKFRLTVNFRWGGYYKKVLSL